MDFIIDFYKNLDALDVFIFWGVIVVIGLLLIFSIILVNKNNKLTKIVNSRENAKEKDDYNDIPIYSNHLNNMTNYQNNMTEDLKNNHISNGIDKEEIFKMRDERLLEDLPDLPIDKSKTEELYMKKEKQINRNNLVNDYNSPYNMENEPHTDSSYLQNDYNSAYSTNNYKSMYSVNNHNSSYETKTQTKPNFQSSSLYNENIDYQKQDEYKKTREELFNIKPMNQYHTNYKDYASNTDKHTSQHKNNQENSFNTEIISSSELNKKSYDTHILKKDDNIQKDTFKAEDFIPNYNEKNTSVNDSKANNTKELYQKNVLREMSFNQTSPINITSNDKQSENKVIKNTNKVDETLNTVSVSKPISKNNQLEETKINEELQKMELAKKTRDEYIKKEIEKYKQEISKREKELLKNSQPTSSNIQKEKFENKIDTEYNENDDNDITRTAYELEQEENAIISYKELMEKKDSIQTIDEEEAVISIEELMNKQNKDTKKNNELYGLTEDKENNDFISELKKFRDDL